MSPSGGPAFGPGSLTPGSTSTGLIEGLKARQPDAWQRLADLYGPLVYGWCRRHGLGAPDAADVMQEVFAAVSTGIDRLAPDQPGSTLRGWLWGIARHKICDVYRAKAGRAEGAGGTDAQQRLARIPEQLPESTAPGAGDQDPGRSLFYRALEMVRAEFEQRTWEAFWRVVVDGRDTADVAADLGVTANAVRQSKSRVLRRLRAELGDGP